MSEPGRCLPHRRWRRDDLPPVAGCGLVLWFLVPCDENPGSSAGFEVVSFQVCRIFRPFHRKSESFDIFFSFSVIQNLAGFLGTVEMMVPDPCQEMAQAGNTTNSWCNTGWTSRIYTKLKAPVICSWVEYILIFVCFFGSVALNHAPFFWGGEFFLKNMFVVIRCLRFGW